VRAAGALLALGFGVLFTGLDIWGLEGIVPQSHLLWQWLILGGVTAAAIAAEVFVLWLVLAVTFS
jgi:hypothetical protein